MIEKYKEIKKKTRDTCNAIDPTTNILTHGG